MKIPDVVKPLISQDQVILVATSDRTGNPHMAAAKGLILLGEDRVAFENWFCFQTLKNIAENPNITISLMAPRSDHGFQLIGTVEKSVPTAMMDGFTPEDEKRRAPFPQTEYQLQVKIEKVLELSTGPHSDEPPR